MNDTTYNGWKNRSTWAVNLNFTNDEVAYAEYLACATTIELEGAWLDLFEPGHDGVDLNEVDWKRILEASNES